jgi:L-galactose dehydrogenase
MLQAALAAPCWDVIMVGFSLVNPSARIRVLPRTQRQNLGVFGMFAVRRALSHPAHLKAVIAELRDRGQLPRGAWDDEEPLGFLLADGKAATLPEAAYRFCRHEPGIHTVLTGTGSVAHLTENVTALLKSPLAPEDLQRLADLFGRVDSVSGD